MERPTNEDSLRSHQSQWPAPHAGRECVLHVRHLLACTRLSSASPPEQPSALPPQSAHWPHDLQSWPHIAALARWKLGAWNLCGTRAHHAHRRVALGEHSDMLECATWHCQQHLETQRPSWVSCIFLLSPFDAQTCETISDEDNVELGRFHRFVLHVVLLGLFEVVHDVSVPEILGRRHSIALAQIRRHCAELGR